jgi:hypothetical protein
MKIVPQLDTYPRLVSFGQTWLGKVVLLVSFAVGLRVSGASLWIEMTVPPALMSCFPAKRRQILSLTTLYWLLFHSDWLDWAFIRSLANGAGGTAGWNLNFIIGGILAAAFLVCALFFQFVRGLRKRRVGLVARRPILCLITGYATLLAVAGLAPLTGTLRFAVWGVIAATAPYLWYFAYALKDAAAGTPDGFALQFGTLRPFWGGSFVPYPKGAAYLRRIEARDSSSLSIMQLKAIKLLMWVFVLRVLLIALDTFLYGEQTRALRIVGADHWVAPNLAIPELATAVQYPVSIYLAWASVIAHFAKTMLKLAVWGHVVIACCRMAGFNALRNTYRPLESRTVAEFWNRYYYYFKELLVEFFFFPVFTRYFKQHRRFRVFAATIAAATIGNMTYHFLRDYSRVAEMGLWKAIAGFQMYAVYATLLGLGIGISQLRGGSGRGDSDHIKWWRRALTTAGVLSFFCLLEIFDQEDPTYNVTQALQFVVRLFAIPV